MACLILNILMILQALASSFETTSYKNALIREVYWNISNGFEIRSLKNSSKYPRSPDLYELIEEFDTPRNACNSYGQRIRGWVQVPQTGSYGFFSTCKSECEFYISLDQDPVNKRKVICQTNWSLPSTWTQYAGDQDPTSIFLKSSLKYYVEALMTGNTDGDHLSIGAQLLGSEANSILPITKSWFSELKIGQVECSAGLSCNASEIEMCINEGAPYYICACKNGYLSMNDSFRCEDVNECMNQCKGENVTCKNLNGTFECLCPFGLFYNYTSLLCEDDGLLICNNWNRSFECVCPSGYMYNYTSQKCEDLNECVNLCKEDRFICNNLNGLVECACPPGFLYNYSSLQCHDIDECVNISKCNNFTCNNLVGSYECTCPSGFFYNYTSLQCDACINLCNHNKFACNNWNESFECACPYGFLYNYTILKCEDFKHVNLCVNFTCNNLIGSFECNCPSGFNFNYTSMQCEDIDECIDIFKCIHATCSNLIGSFECVCPSGFFYNFTSLQCEDVNECFSLCKGQELICNNLNGSFECICPTGFFYNYTSFRCEDIDECLTYCIKDKDNAVCVNLNGSYECTCSVGFFFNYTTVNCQDSRGLVQEVYLNVSSMYSIENLKDSPNFPKNPDLYDTLRSFDTFTNISDYHGERFRGWVQVRISGNYTFYSSCKDICQLYLSADNDPGKKRILINQTQSSIHYNWTQYPEEQVSQIIMLKVNQRYYIEAVMLAYNYGGHMAVGLQLYGNSLYPALLTNNQLSSIRIRDCSKQCQSNEQELCISENSTYMVCTCQNGYTYVSDKFICSDIDECGDGSHDCTWSNSMCNNLKGSYFCSCQAGWRLVLGQKLCEDIDECINLCKGYNMTCKNLNGSYICLCPKGFLYNYYSLICEDVDECVDHCKGLSVSCKNLNGSYECLCPKGYFYNYNSLLCQDIDECVDVCKEDDMMCKNLNGSYECTCLKGFTYNYTSLQCQETMLSVNIVKIFTRENVLEGENFETAVTVVNGTKLQIEIDFGDEIPLLAKIVNATLFDPSFSSFPFSHKYFKCGKYSITIRIINLSSKLNHSAFFVHTTNVTVFCNLSAVKLSSNVGSGKIIISLVEELSLYISQDSGSYVNYTVNWGDGASQFIDQSHNLNLLPFLTAHTYKSEGNYTVLVVAMNAVQTMNESIKVQVHKCLEPSIDFNYGTQEKPISILQSVGYDFIANIGEFDKLCEKDNVTFEWLFSGVKSKGSLTNHQVIYKIKSNELAIGSYKLSFVFTHSNITTVLTAFFFVTKKPLFIDIENGVFRKVAYRKIKGNVTIYQNFTLSAESSYDPEDLQANFEGISFQWKCKRASNFSAFEERNLTFKSNFCINDTWISLNVSGSKVLFNTVMFVLGLSYKFEVIGTKGIGEELREASFVQEIVFIDEDVFDIKLICLTNCDQKINFQQPTILSYSCVDCGSQLLIPDWLVLDDLGRWPNELLQNNSIPISFNDTNLTINAGILLESKNYTFILQIAFKGYYFISNFQIKKTTCSLPVPGYCYVRPLIGYAANTNFKVACEEWSDSDGKNLSYYFFYDDGHLEKLTLNTNEYVQYPMLNPKTTHLSYLNDFLLGTGDEHNNYTIRVHVRVIGKYKAFTEYKNISVQVLPTLQPINLTRLSTVDINDTQGVSLLLQAIGSVINKALDVIDNEELTLQKQEQLLENQKLRNKMIELLAQTTLFDLNDVKTVSDSLSILSKYPSEVAPKAQNIAAETIRKMAKLFTEENIKALNSDAFNTMTQSLLQSVSNVFNANTNSVEKSQSVNQSVQMDSESRNSVDVVSKLLESLEDYFYAAQTYKSPGETATIGSTSAFNFLLKKELKNELSNISVSNDGSGFTLPEATEMFNKSFENIPILVNNLCMKNQPFTWDFDRSQNIASELQSLSLSTLDRLPIKVSNLQQPISIAIKNIPEKIKGLNLSLSMPEYVQLVSLVLKSSLCNMMLQFNSYNDPHNLTWLIVYIQYGKIATENDYDIKLNISNKAGVSLSKNQNSVWSFNVSKEVLNQKENLTENWFRNSSLFIKRNQEVRLLNRNTLILWDFQNSTYGFLNNSVLFLSFSYIGPMPDKRVETNPYTFDEKEYEGKFEYEVKSFCSECNYWNEGESKWMSDGCELDLEKTSFEVTKCKCKHLTAFGAFFVAPNVIPTPTLTLLKDGYLLLVIVGIIILIFISGLIVARRMDKKDNTKFGVCPLLDNRDEDCYLYQVTVNTGNRINAGTNSNIFFTLAGEFADSGIRRLKDMERQCFQRSASDSFILTTPSCLGDLSHIRLWHDNKGGGWYLRNVEVLDLQTDTRFYFIAKRWIAIDRGDCALDVIIPVSASEELTHFDYLFATIARNEFFENHLWFSIFARPPRSIFTRCQRLSVAILLLMTQMTASTMFYGRASSDPTVENKVAGFNFTWQQVFVGLVSGCITVPVNLFFVGVFRLINPFYNLDVRKTVSNESSSTDLMKGIEELSSTSSTKKKKPFFLPHWVVYVTWFFCIVAILTCGSIVLLYGMSFGNKKSLDWISSITISLVQDVFLLQPLKIFIMAFIAALVLKKIDDKSKYLADNQGKALAHDEHWLHKFHEEPTIFEREDLDISPPNIASLSSMKEARMHQLKLRAITRELLLYLLFAVLVFFLAYASRESYAYMQTNDIKDLFHLGSDSSSTEKFQVLEQLQSFNDFWLWLDAFFLPQVFPEPWFNLSNNVATKNFPGKLFINDLNSKIINGIRIRQARVKPYSCLKANLVADFFFLDCLSEFKPSLEETQDFDFNWTLPKTVSVNHQSINPWKYQTSNELDGYPFGAKLETYFGGGYVIEIFPKWNNKKYIDVAKQRRWIDRQTRAVFIEFALFNAATNNFNMVTIVFEFPPSGGLIPSYSVATFKLYSTSQNDIVIVGSQLLFFLMMFIFTIRECRMLRRIGWMYFKVFWNLLEVMLILLSILAVVFYIYRGELAKQLLNRLPNKEPQKFINFQFASYWDLVLTYIVSLIVFFVNIKFIKILKFNRRISILSATLRAAWYPLSMLAITFFVILAAIICFSNLTFGAMLDGYQTYFQTITSVVSLLLGKFDFNQFQRSNVILGPVFFFGFNIWINWIMMNMFISILSDAFSSVRLNVALLKDEYNLLSSFKSRIKGLLGLSYKKKIDFESFDEKLKSIKFVDDLTFDDDNQMSYVRSEESHHSWLDNKLSMLDYLIQKQCDESEVLITPLNCDHLFFGNFLEASKLKTVIEKELEK